MINSLSLKHKEDKLLRRNEVQNSFHAFVYSQDYCKLRGQEKVYFSLKEYKKANVCRLQAEELDKIEKENHKITVKHKVEQEVQKLIKT